MKIYVGISDNDFSMYFENGLKAFDFKYLTNEKADELGSNGLLEIMKGIMTTGMILSYVGDVRLLNYEHSNFLKSLDYITGIMKVEILATDKNVYGDNYEDYLIDLDCLSLYSLHEMYNEREDSFYCKQKYCFKLQGGN